MALPHEYNLLGFETLDTGESRYGAPRVLHFRGALRDDPGDPDTGLTLDEIMPRSQADHVRRLIAADASLGGDETRKAPTPNTQRRKRPAALRAGKPDG